MILIKCSKKEWVTLTPRKHSPQTTWAIKWKNCFRKVFQSPVGGKVCKRIGLVWPLASLPDLRHFIPSFMGKILGQTTAIRYHILFSMDSTHFERITMYYDVRWVILSSTLFFPFLMIFSKSLITINHWRFTRPSRNKR